MLKKVDELCDAINNGDPSLERSEEINQNLNNAVSCYRNKLLPNFIEQQIKVEDCDDLFQNSGNVLFEKDNTVYLPYYDKKRKSHVGPHQFKYICSICSKFYSLKKDLFAHLESIHHEEILKNNKNGNGENIIDKNKYTESIETLEKVHEHVLKPVENSDDKYLIDENHEIEISEIESKEKKTKKKLAPRKLVSRKYLKEMFENVKNQCGVHSIVTMAEATKINASTLGKRLNREGITFSEQQNDGNLNNDKCYFCKVAKNEVQFSVMIEKDFDDAFFSYLR